MRPSPARYNRKHGRAPDPSMTMRTHRPRPPLDRFVDCFWHNDGDRLEHRRERMLPNGSFALIVNLSEDRIRRFAHDADPVGIDYPGALVSGAHAGYYVRDTSAPKTVIGVHFRPGGAAPLLGLPAGPLAGCHVGLEDIWGRSARALRDRLIEAATPDERFAILSNALLARLERPFGHHPAVGYALRRLTAAPALTRIAEVRADTGYGAKRFIQLFHDAVGLTPKLYCRVQRFQGVIDRLARGERVEWAAVAADSGYCDQSHLNREFRAFAGMTPTEYRPVATDRPNHVAIGG